MDNDNLSRQMDELSDDLGELQKGVTSLNRASDDAKNERAQAKKDLDAIREKVDAHEFVIFGDQRMNHQGHVDVVAQLQQISETGRTIQNAAKSIWIAVMSIIAALGTFTTIFFQVLG